MAVRWIGPSFQEALDWYAEWKAKRPNLTLEELSGYTLHQDDWPLLQLLRRAEKHYNGMGL